MKAACPYRLRDFTTSDSEAIYRINDSEIPNVTLFAPGELSRLADQAFYFRLAESSVGEVVGFLLALDETADYASLNFQWFKSRYSRFIYIDRVVISASAQGSGAGRLLYADLCAKAVGLSPLLTCEVNIRPSNPKSLHFHKALGFAEAGIQDTEGGKKTVALLTMNLPPG